MARVRLLPCCARHLSGCTGTVEAHHAGPRPGTAMKAPDSTCIPLCRGHHGALHAASYPFTVRDHWTKERRRRWQDEQIRLTQEELRAGPFDPDEDRRSEAWECYGLAEVQIND